MDLRSMENFQCISFLQIKQENKHLRKAQEAYLIDRIKLLKSNVASYITSHGFNVNVFYS